MSEATLSSRASGFMVTTRRLTPTRTLTLALARALALTLTLSSKASGFEVAMRKAPRKKKTQMGTWRA